MAPLESQHSSARYLSLFPFPFCKFRVAVASIELQSYKKELDRKMSLLKSDFSCAECAQTFDGANALADHVTDLHTKGKGMIKCRFVIQKILSACVHLYNI
jgi:hypothetical protein